MKVSGTAHLAADRAAVWAALTDPAVLVRSIPGCRRLEALGDDAYRMSVAAGVGAVKGVYDGEVRLTDQEEPGSFRMHAKGAGAPGTIGADVLVTLAEAADGGTDLTYDADAVVGGMIGGVGQRMLVGVSKKMAAEFFANVDAVLSAAAPAGLPGPAGLPEEPASANQPPSFVGRRPGPSTAAAASSVSPAAQAVSAGQVFTAPEAAPAPAGQPGFLVGVVVGAAVALAGAVVGGWVAGRRRG